MSGELLGIVLFFGMFVLLLGGLVLAAYLASRSRRLRQIRLLKEIPADNDFYIFVRYNREEAYQRFLKLKRFEGIGILYIVGTRALLKSTRGSQHEFDILTSKISWNGDRGLLKWFSIGDGNEKFYINAEKGKLIFSSGAATKATTRDVFEKLMQIQAGN